MKLKGLRVLISDDSMLARRRTEECLKDFGCEILKAKNGKEAVQIYKEEKPDIVLMDIIMPVADGIDALKDIRMINPEAKVIMISSVGTESYIKEALKAGAIDFLQKPLEVNLLEKMLLKYCKEVK